ncbi:family 20 glycosylhydrolase [Microbacterium sp. NIBRBAC000506063]|uniref:family 20 glycosylhydrolase n=1 Tax=Microbacterium sp. NIBRBAC000506063 TaxID=2734618 RepID=UPI0021D46D2B|nr:family 20 glycosylhydrolase [Microbacterium sp. NIBRBAC000506063]
MKPTPDFPVGLVWAGIVPVRQSYEWEPSGLVPGLADEAILGVEAPLWSETVRAASDIDQLIFPRAAAQAEIAWSQPAGTPERSWESFAERVGRLAPLWKAAGWGWHAAPEIPWSTS